MNIIIMLLGFIRRLMVKIYTDGGYSHSQDMGAWAYVTEDEKFASGVVVRAASHNIDCELFAIVTALNTYPDADIYTDLQGAVKWATGEWKTATPVTQSYKNLVASRASQIHWIKGHSGDILGEAAHRLVQKVLSGQKEPTSKVDVAECIPTRYSRLKAIVEFMAFADIHIKKPDYDILEWLADYGMDADCATKESVPEESELILELAELVKG